jgi:hypothetical protein
MYSTDDLRVSARRIWSDCEFHAPGTKCGIEMHEWNHVHISFSFGPRNANEDAMRNEAPA